MKELHRTLELEQEKVQQKLIEAQGLYTDSEKEFAEKSNKEIVQLLLQKLAELDAVTTELKSTRQYLCHLVTLYKHIIQRLSSSLQEEGMKSNELREAILDLEAGKKMAEDKIEILNANIEIIEAEKKRIQAELDAGQFNINHTPFELQENTQLVRTLQGDVKALRQRLEELENINSSFEGKGDVAAVKQREIDELKREVEAKEDEIRSSKHSAETMEQELNVKTQQIEELNAKGLRQEDTVTELRQDLTEKEKLIEALKAEEQGEADKQGELENVIEELEEVKEQVEAQSGVTSVFKTRLDALIPRDVTTNS